MYVHGVCGVLCVCVCDPETVSLFIADVIYSETLSETCLNLMMIGLQRMNVK